MINVIVYPNGRTAPTLITAVISVRTKANFSEQARSSRNMPGNDMSTVTLHPHGRWNLDPPVDRIDDQTHQLDDRDEKAEDDQRSRWQEHVVADESHRDGDHKPDGQPPDDRSAAGRTISWWSRDINSPGPPSDVSSTMQSCRGIQPR